MVEDYFTPGTTPGNRVNSILSLSQIDANRDYSVDLIAISSIKQAILKKVGHQGK
jgi:hypothetical protein